MAPTPSMAQFLSQSQHILTDADQERVLNLIGRASFGEGSAHCSAVQGVRIKRAGGHQSGKIYQVSGVGHLRHPAETVFELLCNVDLIPEWDMLFKGGRFLSLVSDASGRVEVAHMQVVYGLPAFGRFVADRDFVIRCVRVSFPNGVRVLSCASLASGERVDGDPGPTPGMIRGHMWETCGYVVTPTPEGCCVHISLQVDPRGWIPHSVVNFALEATALNINRLDSALRRLPPNLLDRLPDLNRRQSEGCAAPPPPRRPSALRPEGIRDGRQAGALQSVEAGAPLDPPKCIPVR